MRVNGGAVFPFALFVHVFHQRFAKDIMELEGGKVNENQRGRLAAFGNCEPFW